MPWNGTGTFVRVYSWVTDAANGIFVRADRMDTDSDDIANGISNCITKDGQTASPVLNAPTLLASPSVGDNSLKVPTTTWVNNLALNAALPAQLGNSGKIVTTDGTNASWTNLLKTGTIRFADSTDTTKLIAFNAAGITTGTTRTITMPDRDITLGGIDVVNSTVTTSTTLTTSRIYVPIQMSSLGQSVTAPAATGLLVGGPQIILDNSQGKYSAGFRDSTGTLIMAVGPGGVMYCELKDNSTAAGVWSVTGNNLEPGLVNVDNTFSSTYSSSVYTPFANLDSNKSIHFLTLAAGGFAAVAVDKSTGAVGTPISIDSGTTTIFAAFAVSSTSAIVFWSPTGPNYKAAIISLSGATTLSLGAIASTTNTVYSGEDFSGAPKIVQLTSTLYLSSYTSGTNTSVAATSVSGTAVTIGTPANIITANSVSNSTVTFALTSTTGLVVYKSGAAAPYANNGVVISVSGTTCTVGTPAALTGVSSSLTAAPASCLLSATKCLVVDDNNTAGSVIASVFTIASTTVTAGTLVSVETGITTSFSYTSNSTTRYNAHLTALTSSTALLWYLDNSSVSRAVVLSESGGVVTAGTILYNSFCAASSSNTGFGMVSAVGTTDFMTLQQEGVSSAWSLKAIPHKISGTTVTYGASSERLLGSVMTSALTSGGQGMGARLSSGDYLIAPGTRGYGFTVIRANGDVAKVRGTISVPNLSPSGTYPLAVNGNRVVYLGGAYGTTVSSSTLQIRLISVEIAA